MAALAGAQLVGGPATAAERAAVQHGRIDEEALLCNLQRRLPVLVAQPARSPFLQQPPNDGGVAEGPGTVLVALPGRSQDLRLKEKILVHLIF